MKYRSEIDGLRAIAVVPVILFHAGFELFSGGFVGVDVFFVISGYLITTILIDDIENNRFSLVNFYERRARRILPALSFVMLVCIPFAWMWLLPSQMKDFSKSVIAVSLFASNILFWKESGYFDTAAEEKILLHTWSLAVEEQYYLLFPIFIFLAWRFGKNRVFWMIVVLAGISLALSEWGWRNKATANFYLAPTRAWELFAGSIAAFIVQKRGVQANNTLSTLGLAAIIYAIFAYDKSTPFPSVYALVPVIGVVLLVLFAEKETLAAKLLSTKLFVGIGLISYSAYLWHQPLFAFARIRLEEAPNEFVMMLLSIASVLLAILSWKFIEQPFRKRNAISQSKIFIASVVTIVLFISVGMLGRSKTVVLERLPSWEKITSIPNIKNVFCHNDGRRTAEQLTSENFCTIGSGNVSLAIIGDSHAGALFEYAGVYLKERNLAAWAISGGFCPPLMNGFETGKECKGTTEIAFEKIIANENVTEVILSAQWAIYTKGYRDKGKPRMWKDYDGLAHTVAENPILFERSFRVTIEQLLKAKKNITVVMPVPEFSHDAYKYIQKKMISNGISLGEATKLLPSIPINSYYSRNAEVFDVFKEYEGSISFIYVSDLFCDKAACYQQNNSELPLYSDENHVNYYGASLLISRIFEKVLVE